MEVFLFIVTAIGLGAGLAMDACAVSMANGLAEPKMKLRKIFLIASFFGVFQILMPVLGYLAVTVFNSFLGEKFSTVFGYLVPWLALIILSFLGIKMIVEGVKEGKEAKKALQEGKEVDEESTHKVLTIKALFIQAIATSIDALSVGIIYGEQAPLNAYLTFAIVGVVTFGISVAAVFIGKKFGTIFSNKATIAGGIILVAIGLEIFFTHFSDVTAGIQALFNL